MIKIGSHVSFSKANNYLVGACQESICNQANCMMFYLGAPQSFERTQITPNMIEEYNLHYKKMIPIENIIVHAPYIINPASPEKHNSAIELLVKEIQNMNKLGLKWLVLHPGSSTTFDPNICFQTLVNSLKTVLARTTEVHILLETMAGKGGEIGSTFEELKSIIEAVNSERINICLDTCHIWDAGYDVCNWFEVKNQLQRLNLIHQIKLIHLNDSKNSRGSHKDRHENIGKGTIGLATLKMIVHDQEFATIPKILETPYEDGRSPYLKEIEMLK